MEELRLIFLGQITTVRAGREFALAAYKPLHNLFLKKVVKMSPYRYRKHWIRLIFAGHGAAPPKQFENPKAMKQFVLENRCAIAFIDVRDVDDSVKVLKINGKLPSDKEYPLQ
ncbi:MAG: hypothetical protein Q9P14_17205 [candidate division KSB1 bacterium]|nr:hypothetical protein [candidate division KSB1 bacterium]MDQ7062775.1 hypothetical protein [candidate division KSB1 bacterium]